MNEAMFKLKDRTNEVKEAEEERMKLNNQFSKSKGELIDVKKLIFEVE